MLRSHARSRGKSVALISGKRRVTYAELFEMSSKLASYLKSIGVKEGDKVALFLRNSIEFPVSVFAVSALSAVCIPINTFLKSDELSYIVEDSDAVAMIASTVHARTVESSMAPENCLSIVWEGGTDEEVGCTHRCFYDILSDMEPLEDSETAGGSLDDTAVIFCTSGTTGKPKGAMLSNRNIFSNAESAMELFHIGPSDRSIVFLPMFHSFTFSIAMMLPLYAGGSVVVIQSLRPFGNIFKQVLLRRVTLFFGVPDLYNAIAKADLPWYFLWFNRIRVFVSGASALRKHTLEAMQKRFRRAKLLEGYGLSEASPAVCINTLEKQKVGSVGPAMPGYEVKIVDEAMRELPTGEVGEIAVIGDNVMQGYYRRPEATRETLRDGTLLTGDLGRLDEDGYLYIVDRKKDMIISKGINIYPREIEEHIDRFPGVKASAVVGIADDRSGEIPVAFIEPEDEVPSIDSGEVRRYLGKLLASFKIPKHIVIVEELPRNATGKILKRELRESAEEKISSS